MDVLVLLVTEAGLFHCKLKGVLMFIIYLKSSLKMKPFFFYAETFPITANPNESLTFILHLLKTGF